MEGSSKYKRVLVKLSGEGLCSHGGFGVEPTPVAQIVKEIIPLSQMGVQTAIVVGGGNFIRGKNLASDPHIQRTTADYMGMLATVINALALQDALEKYGVQTRVMSAITMTSVCEPFIRRKAIRHLEKGRVIIMAGGTGSPYFSTDTCASLRASEINADVVLKATKVDGVFDSDPVKNPNAKRYEKLTYQQVLNDRLGVMDLTAISMCMESEIPIIVFDVFKAGNLAGVVQGKAIGTLVTL